MTGLSQLRIEPLNEHLGVRLSNFDFEAVGRTEEFIDLMKKLLDKHLVVLMPKQPGIEPSTIEHFTAQWGPLVNVKRAGNTAHHVSGAQWIKVISNGVAADGVPYGDGNNSAQIWHSDSTPWEAPVGHISFYCRQTANPAPTTSFKNMIKVYAALPQATKDRIDDLRVIHHFYPRQIEVAIHANGPSMSLEDRRVGVQHPLVRRHLGTHKPFLYLPTRRDSLVVGMSDAQSRTLLTELWDFANACDVDVGAALQKDDFIIWDNSATVHDREGWPNEQVRIMWHTSSEGEVPVPWRTRRTVNTIGLSPDEARKANQHALASADY